MSAHPILATVVVPWTPDWKLDEPRFRHAIKTIAEGLTRYLYIFGTAGEGYAVNDEQFDRIARVFWEASQEHKVRPVVGIITLSLPTIISRIERCRALGFREFQLSLPSWGPLNDVELDAFFAETCGRFPDCQFHHYNLLRTKRLLTSVEYKRLAAAHPNFIAVKSSAKEPEIVADLLSVAPRLKFFFTEGGFTLASAKTRDIGLLISIASVNYERAHEFVSHACTQARREELLAGIRAIGANLREVCAGRYHIDGAFDKLLHSVNDPSFPMRLLPPYAHATEEEAARFRAMLPDEWKHRP